MNDFLHDLLRYGFLQTALIAGVLASVACGSVGALVVARRNSYIAGAIAHSVLGGMGVARWLDRVHGFTWATPMVGALVAALLAAVLIGIVGNSLKQRQDILLSAIWSIGMAVGISFIAVTPGYQEDLMSYLFGNILLVSGHEIWLMLILNGVILMVLLLFYDRFLAISFHQELTRLRGINTTSWELLLLVLVALTVVLLSQVVGLIMVIALLTLPAATALRLSSRLWTAMLIAGVLSLTCIVAGLAISYSPQLPAGATIIQCAGVLYLAVVAVQAFPVGWRRNRL